VSNIARSIAAMLLATILAGNVVAADLGSWQNLAGLKPAQKIDVAIKSDVLSGEFVRFDDQGITIREKKGERTVAQADVRRVSLAKRSRAVWIGVAAGGGGGAAAGAALGSRLANESGGDFNNLKGAITVACAGVGALIGAVIGSSARRTTVIYRK
jgi:hypothetical protein